MYTWIGAARSSRYTGFCSLHCRRPRVAETLDGRDILGQHRRGPHASTNSPIQQHVRNHLRPSLCPVCSALSARRDGDIDPIFDSYPRRSWPGAFAGTTDLGTRGHILIPRWSAIFLRVDTATCHGLRKQGSIIHPSTHPSASTVKAIYSLSPCVGVRPCLCMFICCWLA